MSRPDNSVVRSVCESGRRWLGAETTVSPFRPDDARPRVLLSHVAALAGGLVILAIQSPARAPEGAMLVGLVIAAGFSVLRVVNVTRKLAFSTIVLDAVGMALLLAGTGAPDSPFYFVALAGVWWALHIPRRRSGLVYGMAFAGVYTVLIASAAVQDRALEAAFEDVVLLVIVAALPDWFVRVDKRALELSEALSNAPLNGNQVAMREGLQRALGAAELPVDVVLAAAQLRLTVVQTELLAYLAVGLTNLEIADALNVSEATVRYRLTRLYRALGVRRRREAVRRAFELGLSFPVEGPPSPGPRRISA
jgi:DNA-binding CsgD family transcriptional regulator